MFAARLSALIGRQSVLSFARACGLAESVLRTYLHDGRMPPLDKALAIATAAGVSLDWLASGRGPRATAEAPAAYAIRSAHASDADEPALPPFDAAVLEEVLKAVLAAPGQAASPEEVAALAVARYRQAMERDSPE